MIKRLRKVGNSNALLLDKPILELLGLEENGEVQLTVDRGSLIVTPANPRPVDKERFEACLERVVAERRDVLKRLAERNRQTGYQVPVLVTSAVKEESSKRRYELETQTSLSVEAYMEKPYSPPMLLQRVERILQKHRATE